MANNDPLITEPVAQCFHGRLPSGVPIAPNRVTGVVDDKAPAYFVERGSIIPGNLADLINHGALGETTAWASEMYIVLGDQSEAYRDGTDWQAGRAP